MKESWLKLHTSILHSKKVKRLPPAGRWIYIALLCLAKDCNLNGKIGISEKIPLEIDEIIDEIGVKKQEFDRFFDLAKELNLIEVSDKFIVIPDFQEKQYCDCIEATYSKNKYRSAYRNQLTKKLRFQVMERDNFICQYCGKKAPDAVLEIDHIIPISRGGKNNLDNLKTSCFDCNRGKSNKTILNNSKKDDTHCDHCHKKIHGRPFMVTRGCEVVPIHFECFMSLIPSSN